MRTRQKLTAIGALTLASTAIGGGALVTAHAMTDEAPATTGTMTVISLSAGDDEAIQCTFDDVDLPVAVISTDGAGIGAGVSTHIVVAGSTEIGTATATEGDTLPALPAGEPGQPTVVFGSAQTGDGPTSITNGTPPDGADALPLLTVSSEDTRPGTDAECAALRPGTTPAP
ncbi:MAG: hypothetical protein JWN99_2705 [Ilumatobacteraceae bacterium]|nr:hypothetical protein [Ilumatobacteraceae bacterium]